MQRVVWFHLQVEMGFGKLPRLGALLYRLYLPPPALHLSGEVARASADIQQAAGGKVRLALYQQRLASQHVASGPVIDAVHRPLVGVGMADIVRHRIVAANLLLDWRILGHQKAAMGTTIQLEHLSRCVVIYASQGRFKLFTAAQRTSCQGKSLHTANI